MTNSLSKPVDREAAAPVRDARRGEGGRGRLRRVSKRFRAQRWQFVRQSLDWDNIHTVLDLGGTPLIWERSGLSDLSLDITSVNLIGEPRVEQFGAMTVRQVRGDATDPQLGDRDWDLAFSNSVIEHVGGWESIERFATVARKGKRYFVQTPYRYFPLEPHFILPMHFLMPRLLKVLIVMFWDRKPRRRSFRDAGRRVDSVHLLTVRDMRRLFPEAKIVRERRFGLTKSLMAIYCPTAGG